MAEIAPAGGGPNRLFLIIAIGLGGLLVIGIIAVGAFFLLSSSTPKAAAVPTSTVTRTVAPAATATRTVAPTDTPAPTNTSVLSVAVVPSSSSSAGSSAAAPVSGGGVVTATGTFTGTPGTGTPGTGQLPQSGIGENLLLLAGGVVLVLVIFAARRARSVGTA